MSEEVWMWTVLSRRTEGTALPPKRTENRACSPKGKPSTATERPCGATGGGVGEQWRICPAGLTRRTRRTTKRHEGRAMEAWKFGGLEAWTIVSGESSKPPSPAKTPVCAKPDGLTPVALRAKRPLIAPSRPSSSRLKERRRGVERSPTKNANQLISQSAKLPLPH